MPKRKNPDAALFRRDAQWWLNDPDFQKVMTVGELARISHIETEFGRQLDAEGNEMQAGISHLPNDVRCWFALILAEVVKHG